MWFTKTKKKETELPVEVQRFKDNEIQVQEFHYHIENDLKVTYPLRPGDRVISVSNEKNGVNKGTIECYDRITLAKNIVPIVKFDGDETPYTCLSILIPYSDKMYDKLKKLDSRGDKSHWNYVAPSWCQIDGQKFRKMEDSIRKEIRER